MTGRATEADVAAALVMLSTAHAELSTIDAEEATARAALNAWMGRQIDAPLGLKLIRFGGHVGMLPGKSVQ